MKKTLIIAPTYLQITSLVKELPKGNEEIEILNTEQNVTGLGFEVALNYQTMGFEYILASPVGTGIYADNILQEGKDKSLPLRRSSEMMNGCRYRLIDKEGESVSMIMPGAEYDYDLSFIYDEDENDIGYILLSGDMLCDDEDSIECIIETLEELDKQVIFIPNGRSSSIEEDVLSTIYSFNPILIVDDTEAYYLSNEHSGELRDVATQLNTLTNNTVLIIKNKEGIFVKENDDSYYSEVDESMLFDVFVSSYVIALECGVDHKNALMFASEYASQEDIDLDDFKKRLVHFITLK